ncbi:MAG: hypothetical protein QOG97_3188 [Acidimicrobiaceae bacterium]|jgi:hypothetical protein|nr:hypothetical protein [Acidimicrobiaceae bacterium]
MPGSRPKSPGWYPDPDIHPGSLSLLRYWNGRHWTDRRRPSPILADLDLTRPTGVPPSRALEGPARIAELPAPAAEISATREGPGRADTRDRPGGGDGHGVELPTATGGGRGVPPQPPGSGGGGGGDHGGTGGEGGPVAGKRNRRRRKGWLLGGLAVLAAVVVTLMGEAMRPPSPGPRVLTDPQFVKLANAECVKTMPTLRPPDGGPLGSFVSPPQAATQIDTAASGLDALADRLATLPAAEPDRPHIAAWLDTWHRYDAIGHQYADHLRVHGAGGKAPAVLQTGAALAKSADNFARANGLSDCLFAFVYRPDPSQL